MKQRVTRLGNGAGGGLNGLKNSSGKCEGGGGSTG